MLIYNNNPEFGFEGPFDSESFETLADEMETFFYDWVQQKWERYQDEMYQDEISKEEFFAESIADMRKKFISGLEDVTEN